MTLDIFFVSYSIAAPRSKRKAVSSTMYPVAPSQTSPLIQEAIARVVAGHHLSEDAMRTVMEAIVDGRATSAQIASLLTALRMKGETVDEVTAAARVLRERSTAIPWREHDRAGSTGAASAHEAVLLDTCGTGGDQSHSFNISTASAFVIAGAGVAVAKHGNRSVSSSCGSADVCEALGIDLHLPPARVGECIRVHGIGFLFAPALHPAMKHALAPRKEIAIRTLFNLLGPLTNPAGATAQIIGVYQKELTRLLAEVLGRLGCLRAFVVHGGDGMDEITTTAETFYCELREGRLREGVLHPREFGIPRASPEDLLGGTPQENARLILEVLAGKTGPKRDVVLLNAAAGLYTAGAARDISEGIDKAARSIDKGLALEKLQALVQCSRTRCQT